MSEKPHSVNSSSETVERRVFDLSALAVYLVKGHPGYEYVSPVVEEGLRGGYVPIVFDFLPMRAYWIMTQRWRLPKQECADTVKQFLQTYTTPQYPALTRETILKGFQLADELGHDVFDCMYLALARQENASAIVTTDTDFEKLCNQTDLKYINPVPVEVLRRFKEQNK
ncbi:MAG: type II toxin-antitoxin system VapC family toxin [Candidatus Bathyarchaeia archaeon]|jgi:predicted nucleic acid-binding protein